MSRRASESIGDLCREQAGPLLRTVFHYDEDDFETVYLRDDVAEQYTDAELRGYFEQLTDERNREREQEAALHVGHHHATLKLYDGALVLHFPQGRGVGTVISFEPEGCRDMATFVVQWVRALHETSRQEIPNEPDWDWITG